MKIMILATAAVFSLGVGSAYADSEGISTADTLFTQIPGVMAQAPAQNAPADRNSAERSGGRSCC